MTPAVDFLVEKLNQIEPFYSGVNIHTANYMNKVIEEARKMESDRYAIIEEIDFKLAQIEDYAKGEAGDEITKLRKYIQDHERKDSDRK